MAIIGEIKPTRIIDPVQLLRSLADEIEAGDYGDVTTVSIATFGDTGLEVTGGGVDSSPPTIAMVFHAAANKMSNSLIEFGG